MRIDVHGRKTAHKFGRGLMRSAARKTYEQVQAEFEDDPAAITRISTPPMPRLTAARDARGTLDLDLPERKVVIGAGRPGARTSPRARASTATG